MTFNVLTPHWKLGKLAYMRKLELLTGKKDGWHERYHINKISHFEVIWIHSALIRFKTSSGWNKAAESSLLMEVTCIWCLFSFFFWSQIDSTHFFFISHLILYTCQRINYLKRIVTNKKLSSCTELSPISERWKMSG